MKSFQDLEARSQEPEGRVWKTNCYVGRAQRASRKAILLVKRHAIGPLIVVTGALALWSAAAVLYVHSRGWLLYYGDAEAHLNIARRVLDSQTPGYEQIGTVWLPLPHVLMLPFVGIDGLWRSGLAGSIPASACFVIGGSFLFAAARRIFASVAVAAAAVALIAANPNALYLQSIAMTESIFFATLAALLYFCVRFRQTQGWGALVCAAVFSMAGSLTRYEGWFLMPFVTAYFFLTARDNRIRAALIFAGLAAAGPLYWLAHNWWLTGDPLEFYRGPYSALAIQGSAAYPGKGDWGTALRYYRAAVALCAGPVLPWIAAIGALAALGRRVFWPLLLLALPGAFYLWSMHSGNTPIFVPVLWPNSYYNTRYGLAVLPFLALGSAALAALMRGRIQTVVAVLVVAAGAVYWLAHPHRENWVTWQESRVNSEARREWAGQTANYLAPRYVHGSGIITSFGDLTAIYRLMAIPLEETFTQDSRLPWLAAVTRPELFLNQEWAVAIASDRVSSAVHRASAYGMHYRLEKNIQVKGAPAIEIYRR